MPWFSNIIEKLCEKFGWSSDSFDLVQFHRGPDDEFNVMLSFSDSTIASIKGIYVADKGLSINVYTRGGII